VELYNPGVVADLAPAFCAGTVPAPNGELTGGARTIAENLAAITRVGPDIPVLLAFEDHDFFFPPDKDAEEFRYWQAHCGCDVESWTQPETGHALYAHRSMPAFTDRSIQQRTDAGHEAGGRRNLFVLHGATEAPEGGQVHGERLALPDCDDFDDFHDAVVVFAVDDPVGRPAVLQAHVELAAVGQVARAREEFQRLARHPAGPQIGDPAQDQDRQLLVMPADGAQVLRHLGMGAELPVSGHGSVEVSGVEP